MKRTLQLPLVGILAFVLGMGADHLLLRKQTTVGGDKVDRGHAGSSILDDVSVERRDSSKKTSPSAKGLAGGGGAVTAAELLDMFGSPMMAQRMASTVEAYQRLSSMSAESLQALALELERSPQDLRLYQARHQVFSAWVEADPEGAWAHAKGMKNVQVRQQLYSTLFMTVAQEDPDKAKQMLAEITNPQLREAAIQGFVGTDIMAKDPEFMLKLVFGAGDQMHWQHQSLYSLFTTWAGKDPVAASQAVDRLPPQAQLNAIQGIANSWAMSDPDAVIAWAASLTNGQSRKSAMNSAIQTLAYQNPSKAIEYYKSLPSGVGKREALNAIAQSYFQTDPEAGMAWVESLPPEERSKALAGSLDQLTQTNPEGAAKLFSESPMTNEISGQAHNIARSLARVSSDRAIEWIDTLPPGQAKTNAISGLVQTWRMTDPKAAAKYLEDFGITSRNAHMASDLVNQWVNEDREAAVDWVLSQENKSVRENLVSNMVNQWAVTDTQSAMEFIETLADEDLRSQAASNLLSSLSYQDPEAALQWLEKQPSEARSGQLAKLISNMAHNDPQRAIEVYQEYLPSLTDEQINGEFSSALFNVAANWAGFAPEAAADWALKLPEGNARDQAIASVAQNWVNNDSMAASEWIGKLPAGSMRDQAIQPLVNAVSEDDPEAAFAWALSVSEDNQKQNLLRSVVRQWWENDPQAAEAAVQRAPISDEMAEKVMPGR